MALQATFRPIATWPGERTKGRIGDRFKATYAETLSLLESELRHLRAKNVVIQAGFALSDIRNDGWPRSNARKPVDPGVIVSFEAGAGAMAFPCDRYTDWTANLRAIALSLEALRAVDRYGVTRRSEQYRGWTQLPPPPPAKRVLSRGEAAIMLAALSGVPKEFILADNEAIEKAYRTAAKRAHPDAGGSDAAFQDLQEIMRILRAPGGTRGQ